MRRSHGADTRPLLEPVTKIYSYCDEHKKLFGSSRKARRDNGNFESPSRPRVRRPADESSDDRSPESCTCQLDKSSELIRQYEQRRRSRPRDSPTASCLKGGADEPKRPPLVGRWGQASERRVQRRSPPGRTGRRVYFHESEPRSSRSQATAADESSLNDYSWPTKSSSSSYVEPERFQAFKAAALVKRPPTPRERGGQEPRDRDTDRTSATFTFSKYSSAATSSSTAHKPSTALSTTLDSLPVDLSELSISGGGTRRSEPRPPRVVKPKDGMRRPSTRRMLVYPPDGQTGPPLSLAKKWSNIECSVRGDERHGYRYKVYYLQTFESDPWYPNCTTGSPFERIEDAECSTDNG